MEVDKDLFFQTGGSTTTLVNVGGLGQTGEQVVEGSTCFTIGVMASAWSYGSPYRVFSPEGLFHPIYNWYLEDHPKVFLCFLFRSDVTFKLEGEKRYTPVII